MTSIKMSVRFAASAFCLGGMLLATRTASAQQTPTPPAVPIPQPKPGHITGKVLALSRPDVPQDPRLDADSKAVADLDKSAWTAFRQGNYAVAETKFRAAIKVWETSPTALSIFRDTDDYQGLAMTLAREGHIYGTISAIGGDVGETPQEAADFKQTDELNKSGWSAFRQNNDAVAEAKFRAAIQFCHNSTAIPTGFEDQDGYRGLAMTLTREGRKTEAIAAYQTLLSMEGPHDNVTGDNYSPTDLLNNAILLSQTGKSHDAVNAFNMALPRLNQGESTDPPTTFAFDPMIDEPKLLQSAAHILIGKEMLHQGDYPGALPEFAEAVQLEPGLALAHYYYAGVLGHTTGQMATATAEYTKAIRLDGGNIAGVRSAAERQLNPSN